MVLILLTKQHDMPSATLKSSNTTKEFVVLSTLTKGGVKISLLQFHFLYLPQQSFKDFSLLAFLVLLCYNHHLVCKRYQFNCLFAAIVHWIELL